MRFACALVLLELRSFRSVTTNVTKFSTQPSTLNLKLPRKSGKLERDIFQVARKSEIAIDKMEKVTLVDKEILIATVNGDYCAIGNNDCSADFLKFQ